MNYTLIEQRCIGKQDDAHCEDGLVLTEHYVAVIDGSTSKGTVSYGDKSSGRIAMERICEEIRQWPPALTVQQAAARLTRCIRSYYEAHDLLAQVEAHPENRLTASAVIYCVGRQEVWHVGDCLCLIDDRFIDNPKYWEYPLAQARALFLEKELAAGVRIEELQRHDTGRDYILPLLRFSTRYQNQSNPPATDPHQADPMNYGFAVIDGFPIPDTLLLVHSAQGAHQIVLASDGYPHLFPTLEASERFLAERLADDPLCFRRCKMTKGLKAGNKSFDDRTYVRIGLPE